MGAYPPSVPHSAATTRPLTERQQRFVAGYVTHGNAAQAAADVGYSKGRAKNAGYQLLKNPAVQAAIAALRAPVLEDAQMTLAGHLSALGRIRDKAIAAEQFSAAVAAESHRGKAVGYYTERHQHQHTGLDGGPLRVEVVHTIVDAADAG